MITIHAFSAERRRAAAGDEAAAANYDRLAAINPGQADEWRQRAAEARASAQRNLDAIASRLGKKGSTP